MQVVSSLGNERQTHDQIDSIPFIGLSSLSPLVTGYDHWSPYSMFPPVKLNELILENELWSPWRGRGIAALNKANSLQPTATAVIQAKTLRCRIIRLWRKLKAQRKHKRNWTWKVNAALNIDWAKILPQSDRTAVSNQELLVWHPGC